MLIMPNVGYCGHLNNPCFGLWQTFGFYHAGIIADAVKAGEHKMPLAVVLMASCRLPSAMLLA
jgi:hypothetical protein